MGIELNEDQIYALYDIENWWEKQDRQVYELSGAAGTGKAQPKNIWIPTPIGFRELGSIKEGDYVFNRHGEPIKVLGVYPQGLLDVYEITFEDGRSTKCNSEHLWSYYKDNGDELHVSSLQELMDMDAVHNPSITIPIAKRVNYTYKESHISPYEIGNCIAKGLISQIPERCMIGDENQRLEIIRGIFDGCGRMYRYGIELKIDNAIVIHEILDILRSLGYTYYVHPKDYHRIIPKALDKHQTYFFKNNKRNAKREIRFSKYNKRYVSDRTRIKSIRPLGYKEDMVCIYVDDPEHTYLTENYIVTHNTTLIRYFIDRIGLTMDNVAFVAYMGKAATQMARNGLPAQTIHSLIYNYEKDLDLDENGKIQLNERGKPKTKFHFVKKEFIPKNIKLLVLDEAGMVNKEIREDLLSYNVPLIALGDLNQLPPVIGNPGFLQNPDYILTKIMRQAEGDPIVYLSQLVLNDKDLNIGVYGKSSIIQKDTLNNYLLKNADMVLTCTNNLRYFINDKFRNEIMKIRKLDIPNEGEKVICRKNNWKRFINKNIFLTNGISGTIDYVDIESFNGKELKIDFKPDFLKKSFKNLKIDYQRLFHPEIQQDRFSQLRDQFEFAYAITVHLSQGSQYDNVLFLDDSNYFSKDLRKALRYTAITRAMNSITIAI